MYEDFQLVDLDISIHVPRAGYDVKLADEIAAWQISIHVPRAGYDPEEEEIQRDASRFLSTYPVRGTTPR